ncbi:MAG: prephenate dehydrogenase/arogenate dehydrogenase family protein [Terriglobia bacterium]
MEIGILGMGRFGRFASEILKQDFKISAFDRRKISPPRGVESASLEIVASKPIVIFCVPISQIESVCKEVKPFLYPGQLLMDTCSVKVLPLRTMRRLLPRFVEIVGTHPLFGPDSAQQGIRGFRIALCPVRCLRLKKIKSFLEGKGLEVIVTTPENHDRKMAMTQALYHFLARGVANLKIKVSALSTPGPARLFEDFRDVQSDSLELFADLQTRNPHAGAMRKSLLRSLSQIDRELSRNKRKSST